MKRRTLFKIGLFAILTPFIKPVVAVASMVQNGWCKWIYTKWPQGGGMWHRSRKIEDGQYEIEIASFSDPKQSWSFKTNTVLHKKKYFGNVNE